jgi:hypothetical protein
LYKFQDIAFAEKSREFPALFDRFDGLVGRHG